MLMIAWFYFSHYIVAYQNQVVHVIYTLFSVNNISETTFLSAFLMVFLIIFISGGRWWDLHRERILLDKHKPGLPRQILHKTRQNRNRKHNLRLPASQVMFICHPLWIDGTAVF